MSSRDLLLQDFLTSLADAFRAQAIGAETSATIDRIYGALQTSYPAGAGVPQRRPVCSHLTEALDTARSGSAPVARVADAFAALEPSLVWIPRHAGGPFASDNWPDGHANTTIVGPRGLEDRNDLSIGASLLAPHVRYPEPQSWSRRGVSRPVARTFPAR
jgi:Dimethlysulfonioproprionate lyase